MGVTFHSIRNRLSKSCYLPQTLIHSWANRAFLPVRAQLSVLGRGAPGSKFICQRVETSQYLLGVYQA